MVSWLLMDGYPSSSKVFCPGASRKEGSLTERLRSLTMSKSQPDLRSAASEGMSPTPEIVVLGREARSKSRRFMLSEDGSFNGTASWQAPGDPKASCHSLASLDIYGDLKGYRTHSRLYSCHVGCALLLLQIAVCQQQMPVGRKGDM